MSENQILGVDAILCTGDEVKGTLAKVAFAAAGCETSVTVSIIVGGG
jgi:hypothetical protein